MNAMWNRKDLERPANNVWIASKKAIDWPRFLSALNFVIKDLESQNVLYMEAAILSRLIYRMKSKFRNDKGLKNMEKVNRALLNYLELKLHKEYKELRNCVEPDGIFVNLPTKQMLQYLLIRTQGFAKLMSRIECVARYAAQFFKARISIGHSWTISVIAYAVVSRIWYLVRYLVKRCCLWYDKLFPFVDNFREIGPAWLPQDQTLPQSLKTWLDLPWIDEASDSVPLKDDGKETIFGLITSLVQEPCDSNFQNEDLDVNDSVSKPGDQSIQENLQPGDKLNDEKSEAMLLADDIGMSVDRKAFQLKVSNEIENCVEPVESKSKVKKRKKKLLKKSNEEKKSKVLAVEENVSINSIKGTKKVSSTSVKNEEKEDKESVVRTSKSKSLKAVNKLSKKKHFNTGEIKSREDLTTFLSKNSYPGLDRLQWNMMTKSINKLVIKLDKCQPSEDKKRKFLLKKVNAQIKNWIQ